MKKLFVLVLSVICYQYVFSDDAPITIVPRSTTSGNESTGKYSYLFNNNLKQTLITFAQNNGLKVKFSTSLPTRKLQQKVNGRFTVSNKEELLSDLSNLYGFDWFIYSGILYISTKNKITLSAEVNSGDMASIKDSLKQMNLINDRFSYSEFTSENKVVVSGPKEYVDLVIKNIKSFDVKPMDQQFAVYRLKYSNATDIQLTFNSQQITIPGVATILQALLQGQSIGASKGVNYINSDILEPAKNQASKILTEYNAADNSNGASSASGGGGSRGVMSRATIQADNRLNTIVIRDKSSNLKIYKKLIEVLDVPSPLIQVDVLIVHLDQDKLTQKGINWWSSAGGVSTGFGAANLSGKISNDLSFYYGQVNPGQLLVSNVANFATSLQFLEKNNIAQAMSKPSLVTTDNLPAILGVTENIYLNNSVQNLQAGGNSQSSAAVPAKVQQSLQITPHVIFNDDGGREIKMSIVLQDGLVNEINNASMPTTTQSTLNSQAVIKEGQSLILAGYSRDLAQTIENKVPFFGDIPLLGWFFKSKNTVSHQVETIYFVTPKVVWLKDMYKLNGYVTIDNNKFDIKNTFQVVPKEEPAIPEMKPATPQVQGRMPEDKPIALEKSQVVSQKKIVAPKPQAEVPKELKFFLDEQQAEDNNQK